MLSKIHKDDIIIHYLTISLTQKKEWQAAFVGESIANSVMFEEDRRIHLNIKNVLQFPNPVKLSSIRKNNNISERLQKAILMSMQFYILDIEESDYNLIKRLSGKLA